MITLKDGTTTEDSRLGRLVQFDEQSRQYPIRSLVAAKPLRSYTWGLNTYLDQGHEGACVGFSLAHELAARPSVVAGVNALTAQNIYYEAQKTDPWAGGAYPGASPRYEGTSVLAGVKYVQSQGFISEYRWAFSLEDALLAIGYQGPGILGCYWYEGMADTDAKGFIKPTGRILGGHAIIVRGVSVKNKTVRLTNSWGKGWGINGDCYMTWDDFAKVLANNGEFCIPVVRAKK